MKPVIVLPILLTLLLVSLTAGCGSPTPVPPGSATPTAVDLNRFSDGHFVARYPAWPEDTNRGSDSVLGVAQGPFGVWINRYEILPRRVLRETRKALAGPLGGEVLTESTRNGHPALEYRRPFENITMRFRTLFVYCQARTYVVAVAGVEERFAERAGLFDRVLDAARCEDPLQPPQLETGKLGMIINAAQGDAVTGLYPALRLAKKGGAQVAHVYASWGQLEPRAGEFQWEWFDHVMGLHHNEGLQISLAVDVIHTTVRGEVPPDLANTPWDDPAFIQRFSSFVLTLLDRYAGQVDYLSIGNEVNDYFIAHRDEIDSYRTFFLAVKQAIAVKHPDVKVGMTFAYHDAERQDGLDIVERLNVGDFTPYTLYIYGDAFQFDRQPAELAGYVDRMLALAADKPVAIVELGWSTAESLGGSEEAQAAFVREAFRQLRRQRDRIEFLAWFGLHDGQPETCRKAALSFIPPDSHLAEDADFMSVFIDFLCHLGLRENDGTPKLGWHVWLDEAETYLAEYE